MKFMDYHEKKADLVCAALAAGMMLIEYCQAEGDDAEQLTAKRGRPRVIDVYHWLEENAKFAGVYKMARINQAMSMAERALLITDEFVTTAVDATMKKARSEALRWFAARMDRNTFGDQSTKTEPMQLVVHTTLGDGVNDASVGQNTYSLTAPVDAPDGEGAPKDAPVEPAPPLALVK